MLNDHCHRVSTHLQSINIIIIIILSRPGIQHHRAFILQEDGMCVEFTFIRLELK